MFIAQKKRKESIIEYLLYLWNVEDLIRANQLDMSRIVANVLPSYGVKDEDALRQLTDWWDNLVAMMRQEKKEESGHLRILTVLANDIYNFHLYLLTQNKEIPYQNAFRTAWPDLELWQKKVKGGEEMHHVMLGLSAIYDFYLLKLQKKTILADTTNAILRISHWLSLLSAKYLEAERQMEKDNELSENGEFVAPK